MSGPMNGEKRLIHKRQKPFSSASVFLTEMTESSKIPETCQPSAAKSACERLTFLAVQTAGRRHDTTKTALLVKAILSLHSL